MPIRGTFSGESLCFDGDVITSWLKESVGGWGGFFLAREPSAFSVYLHPFT